MTTKPRIKDWHSPDVTEIWKWKPRRREDVYVLLELEIGDDTTNGADLFQVMIATPEGLRAHAGEHDAAIADRATIVVSEFSWPDLEGHINALVSSCSDMSWTESMTNLQRYFRWEYEDHGRRVGPPQPKRRR